MHTPPPSISSLLLVATLLCITPTAYAQTTPKTFDDLLKETQPLRRSNLKTFLGVLYTTTAQPPLPTPSISTPKRLRNDTFLRDYFGHCLLTRNTEADLQKISPKHQPKLVRCFQDALKQRATFNTQTFCTTAITPIQTSPNHPSSLQFSHPKTLPDPRRGNPYENTHGILTLQHNLPKPNAFLPSSSAQSPPKAIITQYIFQPHSISQITRSEHDPLTQALRALNLPYAIHNEALDTAANARAFKTRTLQTHVIAFRVVALHENRAEVLHQWPPSLNPSQTPPHACPSSPKYPTPLAETFLPPKLKLPPIRALDPTAHHHISKALESLSPKLDACHQRFPIHPPNPYTRVIPSTISVNADGTPSQNLRLFRALPNHPTPNAGEFSECIRNAVLSLTFPKAPQAYRFKSIITYPDDSTTTTPNHSHHFSSSLRTPRRHEYSSSVDQNILTPHTDTIRSCYTQHTNPFDQRLPSKKATLTLSKHGRVQSVSLHKHAPPKLEACLLQTLQAVALKPHPHPYKMYANLLPPPPRTTALISRSSGPPTNVALNPKLSKTLIKRVRDRLRSAYILRRTCFQRHKERQLNPHAYTPPRISLHFRINPTGSIKSITHPSTTPDTEPLAECLKHAYSDHILPTHIAPYTFTIHTHDTNNPHTISAKQNARIQKHIYDTRRQRRAKRTNTPPVIGVHDAPKHLKNDLTKALQPILQTIQACSQNTDTFAPTLRIISNGSGGLIHIGNPHNTTPNPDHIQCLRDAFQTITLPKNDGTMYYFSYTFP